MRISKCVFVLIISVFFTLYTSAQKVQPLNQMEQVKQIKLNPQGQIYLFSDHQVCLYGRDGLEKECYHFEDRIKDYLGVNEQYAALAVKNELKIYKGAKLHKEIKLPEEITALDYAQNTIFIGTSGRGLYFYSISDEQLDSLPNLGQKFINDILLHDSTFSLALDHGIYCYSVKSHKAVDSVSLPNKLIKRLAIADDHRLYAFGEFGDLYLFDKSLKQIQHRQLQHNIRDVSSNEGSTFVLSLNACYRIKEDLELEKVIEGEFSALCVLKNQLLLAAHSSILSLDISQKKIPLDENAFSIYAVDDENFWVGGSGKIYHYLNGEMLKRIDIPLSINSSLSVSALYVSDKFIFAGTMGEGLLLFDHNGKLLNRLLVEGDNNQKNIIQMQAHSDKLWIVYLTGVTTVDLKSLEIKDIHPENIGNNYLYCIKVLDEENFYLGTSVHGLFHYKEGKMKHYLTESTIFSINNCNGHIIASTENDGTYQISYENGESKKLLELNKIFHTAGIGNDMMLIARENELILYHLPSKNQFTLPDLGMRNMQFNSFSSSENYFFLGFENGILKLDKRRLKNQGLVTTHLKAPKLFDQEISLAQHNFDYNENTFTFSYQSFNYYASGNSFYKYRLLGIDSNWQTTTQEFVNYYDLPFGNYTFQVAAGSSKNFMPQNASSYSFSISKPFWLQPLFIAGLAVLLIVVIYVFIKNKEKQIVAKARAEREHLRFEFDQLKNQVDPHFLFNSLNSISDLIEENPSMAVKAVVKLSNVYRSILEYGKIDTIDLNTELQLAEQYFEIHKLRYQHLIEMHIQEIPGENPFRLVPLSCQFLIENAIKHNQISKQKRLKICIYLEGKYLLVENNLNRKDQSASSTSLGLINLKRRYAQLNKKEVIIIDNNETFTVKLPLIYG